MVRINLLKRTLTWQTRQLRRDLEQHVVLAMFLAGCVNLNNRKTGVYAEVVSINDYDIPDFYIRPEDLPRYQESRMGHGVYAVRPDATRMKVRVERGILAELVQAEPGGPSWPGDLVLPDIDTNPQV